MAKRQGRKRLAIDIPESMHDDIKYCAEVRNITITRWVMRTLFAKLKTEKVLEDNLIGIKE